MQFLKSILTSSALFISILLPSINFITISHAVIYVLIAWLVCVFVLADYGKYLCWRDDRKEPLNDVKDWANYEYVSVTETSREERKNLEDKELGIITVEPRCGDYYWKQLKKSSKKEKTRIQISFDDITEAGKAFNKARKKNKS